MRGTGGRGKPGRMGAGANLSEAGTARGFHKRKSMRKGEGRYGGFSAPRCLAVSWLFAVLRAHAGPRTGQHDTHLVLAPGTWNPVHHSVSCLAWLTVRCPRR